MTVIIEAQKSLASRLRPFVERLCLVPFMSEWKPPSHKTPGRFPSRFK